MRTDLLSRRVETYDHGMRILAATDGSEAAGSAVRFAAALASRTRRSRLTVATVGGLSANRRRSPSGSRPSRIEEKERAWPERILEKSRRVAQRLGARARVTWMDANRRGPIEETIAESIARAARRDRTELVVVGSRGSKQFARYLFGSVAHRLVHLCGLPVAVVRAGAGLKSRPLRILAAVDGSRPSLEAVRFASRLARAVPRSRLVVLTVSTLASDIALSGASVVRALGVLPDLDRAEQRAGEKILRDAAKETRRLRRKVELVYSRPRRPIGAAPAIVKEAARRAADLIVLGNAGRSAVNDLMLGSVAQRVLDLSRRPVILVRTCPKGTG